ncbi:MAG: hypothetical protein ACREUE_11225, partial [Panacagrimonas sp.]
MATDTFDEALALDFQRAERLHEPASGLGEARATAAAPACFDAFPLADQALVDGGVFANNPAMCALAEVMRFQPTAEITLLSLGTGQHTRKRTFADVKDWGLVEWARPILDVVFD